MTRLKLAIIVKDYLVRKRYRTAVNGACHRLDAFAKKELARLVKEIQ